VRPGSPAGKWLRAGVEEWEEPLHPGPRGGKLTHSPPQCNTFATNFPTEFHLGTG